MTMVGEELNPIHFDQHHQRLKVFMFRKRIFLSEQTQYEINKWSETPFCSPCFTINSPIQNLLSSRKPDKYPFTIAREEKSGKVKQKTNDNNENDYLSLSSLQRFNRQRRKSHIKKSPSGSLNHHFCSIMFDPSSSLYDV